MKYLALIIIVICLISLMYVIEKKFIYYNKNPDKRKSLNNFVKNYPYIRKKDIRIFFSVFILLTILSLILEK